MSVTRLPAKTGYLSGVQADWCHGLPRRIATGSGGSPSYLVDRNLLSID